MDTPKSKERRRKTVERFCNHCGKPFLARVDHLKTGRGRFCSLACAALHRHIAFPTAGEANPNWKGGISREAYRYKQRQRERYPERVNARKLVADAVRSGRLACLPCEVCGSPDVQAHHDDYSRPLDVRWLCKEHHGEIHGRGTGQARRAA